MCDETRGLESACKSLRDCKAKLKLQHAACYVWCCCRFVDCWLLVASATFLSIPMAHCAPPPTHTQEVLLYVPWPQEVLEEVAAVNSSSTTSPLDALTAVGATLSAAAAGGAHRGSSGIGSGSGSSPCTGPCMRMGLADGPPHSIMPDHLVRAFGFFGGGALTPGREGRGGGI